MQARLRSYTRGPALSHAGDRRPAAEPRPRVGGDHGQEEALWLVGPDDSALRSHGQRVYCVSTCFREATPVPPTLGLSQAPQTPPEQLELGAGARGHSLPPWGVVTPSRPFHTRGQHGW